MILDVCASPEVLEVLQIVKTVLLIIRIAVPLMLILSLSITYMHGVRDNDQDLIQKANKQAISKILAAILVFFIPTFVSIIGDIADPNNKTYLSCLDMATDDNIQTLYVDRSQEYVKKARETLNMSDYQIAVESLKKVKDESKKKPLLDELNEILEYIRLKDQIVNLKNNYDKKKYRELYEKVNAISDQKVKEKLIALLEEFGVGRPLNVSDGTYIRTYDGKKYVEVIPPNATTDLPLIVFLHGDGENGCISCLESLQITKYIKSKKAYEIEDFIYIAVLRPESGYASSYNTTNIKKVIDHVVEQYEIDKDRIYISGFSGGSIITWAMVNSYPNYFAAAIPVSCGAYGSISPNNFKTTPVWSMAGTSGSNESRYNREMASFVRKINDAGGNAKHDTLSGESHGSMQGKVYNNIEIYKWLLSKTKKR